MNINGAIFLFLTNMTFQNVFSVANVSVALGLKVMIQILNEQKITSVFGYFAGILCRITRVLAGTSKPFVPNRCIFSWEITRRISTFHAGPFNFHFNRLSDDWLETDFR